MVWQYNIPHHAMRFFPCFFRFVFVEGRHFFCTLFVSESLRGGGDIEGLSIPSKFRCWQSDAMFLPRGGNRKMKAAFFDFVFPVLNWMLRRK